MPTSIESQGTTLAISYGESPTSFTTIANVIDFAGPGGAAKVIDTTNLSSTAISKRMGLPDEGQLTMNLNLDPDSASHVLLRNARTARQRSEFRITFTDTTPTTASFFGYVMNYSVSGGVDDVIKTAVTVEIDGPVTWV
jgi:hypothetical protein